MVTCSPPCSSSFSSHILWKQSWPKMLVRKVTTTNREMCKIKKNWKKWNMWLLADIPPPIALKLNSLFLGGVGQRMKTENKLRYPPFNSKIQGGVLKNKLAKAWKTRKSPGRLGLKKFITIWQCKQWCVGDWMVLVRKVIHNKSFRFEHCLNHTSM